jgi:tRNA (adenine22-N1)-methyltransferase
MPQKQLSKRLLTVAGYLPECDCIADIGCDHGMLGLYLLHSGKCKTVLATDISDRSLQKARVLFERFGVESRVATIRADGFPSNGSYQAAVVAGIGGTQTMRILFSGADVVKQLTTLVLQPADDVAGLRRSLMESGYGITGETIVYEGRYFPVIAARYCGIRVQLDDLSAEIGPENIKHPDQTVLGYARWRIRVWNKALKQPARTERGSDCQKKAAQILRQLTLWVEENAHAAYAQTGI